MFLETTPDVVFFKDLEGRFTAVSRSLYTQFGLEKAEDMLGKTEFDFFPCEFAEKAVAADQEVMLTGTALLELEDRLPLPDGKVVWIEYSKLPLRDRDGRVVGTLCLSRGTTKRKRAEIGVRKHMERLSRIIEMQRVVATADLDLTSLMETICRRAQELTGAAGAVILMLDGDEFVYRSATGFNADKVGMRIPLEGSLAGWSYANDQSVVCEDTQTDPRTSGLARTHGIRSMVAVPLRHRERMVGQLNVLSQEPNAFDETVVHTLELASVVLSASLSHAAEFDALTRYRMIFEGSPIGIAKTDATGRTVEANPALERMLGYSAAELAELSVEEYTHPDHLKACTQLFTELMAGRRDSYQIETRFRRKESGWIWAQVAATLQRDSDGQPAYAVEMIEDISNRKAAEAALVRQAELNQHQALHDSLTGLANRTLFGDRIQQAIAAAARSGKPLAVLVMDLDRFKEINDSLGHHLGDALLQELGNRLKDVIRASDTAARLGGDEFGLLLPEQSSPADVIPVIERIREAVEEPIVLQGLPLVVEASIGVAFFPSDGHDEETLLQRADVAMYMAKEGNSSHAFYDSRADSFDPARLTLVGELRRGIEQRELVLYYQPKANLASGEVTSVEALLRWNHPERGLVMPDDFIPLAQQTGLIRPLTLYVVDEALRQCRSWQADGLSLAIAVNLSARNLLDVGFPEQVQRLLEKWVVDASLLEFEITESTMLVDPLRAKLVLDKLSSLGIRLAIDDFGTGYSSLAYLKRLPIQEIKIDRSFVSNMISNEDDATIVRSTIELGRNLGLEVVAEGVESQEIWDRISSLGCTTAQGYYLSRPMPAEDVRDWLLERAQQRLAS